VARLLAWAQAWPQRTWAVEGAGGVGHLLAQQLAAAGERVLDVPPLPARVKGASGDDRARFAGPCVGRLAELRLGSPVGRIDEPFQSGEIVPGHGSQVTTDQPGLGGARLADHSKRPRARRHGGGQAVPPSKGASAVQPAVTALTVAMAMALDGSMALRDTRSITAPWLRP
jgi:hypothetical protein